MATSAPIQSSANGENLRHWGEEDVVVEAAQAEERTAQMLFRPGATEALISSTLKGQFTVPMLPAQSILGLFFGPGAPPLSGERTPFRLSKRAFKAFVNEKMPEDPLNAESALFLA